MNVSIPKTVPSALRMARHWVLRDGKKPMDRFGNRKGWQLPEFWSTYQEVAEALQRNGKGADGLGFVIAREPLRESKQIIGIDLDCCRDPLTGWISGWADQVLSLLFSYSEVTISGTGFHVWIYGRLPEGLDSVTSEGQDPAEIPADVWERIKALKPTASRCNSLEIYEDGPRHFTFSGQVLPDYPPELMHRQEELEKLLKECNLPKRPAPAPDQDEIQEPDANWFREMKEATRSISLPSLDILRVVDTTGWEQSGGQLLGPHPTLGSSTGRNVVINPGLGIWAYMHNGLKKGGDAWTWLACECGVVRWEDAGKGSLRDPIVLQQVKEYAVSRGYFSREQLFSTVIPHLSKDESGQEWIDRDPLTEGGNAGRFVRMYGNDVRYCHTFRRWMIWDGQRWKFDTDGAVLRMAEKVVQHIYGMAAVASRKEAREALADFARKSDRNFHLRNVLEIAKNREGVAITSEGLDCDPWLLGTPSGTIDLRNLTIREATREDLITKSIGTKHDPQAKRDRWEAFLNQIFRNDQELIKYIQRAVGYSLTGSMAEQVFFFCHGKGANGKSVFLGVLRALFGEYAQQADFSSFLVQRSEKVRNDLAALAGARLIIASEAEEGSKLSMQVLKAWTGGDPITTRFLHAEFFTFKPQGKIWLAANTKPAISERNFAAWRRVHLIPFQVTIPKPQQDRGLERKLLEELPGILQWALEGLMEYHQIGLEPPEAVRVATEAYRRENDSLEAFIAECCEIQKLAVCRNVDLFGTYDLFCRDSGLTKLSQTKFSTELKSIPGVYSKHSEKGTIWYGIGLNPDGFARNPDGFSKPVSDMQQPKNGENLTGLKSNAEILPYFASRKENIQNDFRPVSKSEKNGQLMANDGLSEPVRMSPFQKEKAWSEVAWLLRHMPRRDGQKIGVTSSDVSKRSGIEIERIEELLLSAGWQREAAGMAGIEIWWATEQAKKAMGVS